MIYGFCPFKRLLRSQKSEIRYLEVQKIVKKKSAI